MPDARDLNPVPTRHLYRNPDIAILAAVRHLLPLHGLGAEIGVGSGRFAAPLGIKIGVDPSKAMRKIAETRGIEAINAVAEQPPYTTGSFDHVLMITTICFVDDIEASFREAARILKTRGTLVVGFVVKDSPLGKTYDDHKRDNVFYREATFYSARDVLKHLARTGFEDCEAVQTIFGPLPDIGAVQEFKPGYGEGGFVVIWATNSS